MLRKWTGENYDFSHLTLNPALKTTRFFPIALKVALKSYTATASDAEVTFANSVLFSLIATGHEPITISLIATGLEPITISSN